MVSLLQHFSREEKPVERTTAGCMGKRKSDKTTVGALPLPTGGKNGFIGVRGGQGRGKNQFQGTTPRKTNRTKLFNTPREGARRTATARTPRAAWLMVPTCAKVPRPGRPREVQPRAG